MTGSSVKSPFSGKALDDKEGKVSQEAQHVTSIPRRGASHFRFFGFFIPLGLARSFVHAPTMFMTTSVL